MGVCKMIYEKLAKIQDTLFVPKGQRNNFGNYSYRSCEDILKTVKPLLKEQGCVLYITNDIEVFGDRVYVKAVCHLVDLDDGSEIISIAHAREEESKKGMDGSQITGSCSSYARKYALAGLFCIDNEKDSDATNEHNTISKKEQTILTKIWLDHGGTEENLLEHLKVKSLDEVTSAMFAKVMEQIKRQDESKK